MIKGPSGFGQHLPQCSNKPLHNGVLVRFFRLQEVDGHVVIHKKTHEVHFFSSFSLWILFLESELELLVAVEIHEPSSSKVFLDHLLKEVSISGSFVVGSCPGSCFP